MGKFAGWKAERKSIFPRQVRVLGPALILTSALTGLVHVEQAETRSRAGDQVARYGSYFMFAGRATGFREGSVEPNPNATNRDAGELELLEPFRFAGAASDKDRAVGCMAQAVYYEAGDDADGQTAVAQVVLNRLRHPSYPDSICAVVYEGSHRQTGCQFTFTCDGSMSRRPHPAAWRRALSVAREAIDGASDDRVGTATHYHADYVTPYWSSSLDQLTKIGSHIFYRFPGRLGSPVTFSQTYGGGEPMAMVPPSEAANRSLYRDPSFIAQPGIPARTERSSEPVEAANARMRPRGKNAYHVDVSVPPGRWAISALSVCGVKPACVYLGYSVHAQQYGTNLSEDRLVFVYIRDGKTGMSTAYWDCAVAQRKKASECLPQEPAKLANLLRPRD